MCEMKYSLNIKKNTPLFYSFPISATSVVSFKNPVVGLFFYLPASLREALQAGIFINYHKTYV